MSTGRLLHGQKLHGVHQIAVPFTQITEDAKGLADLVVGTPLTEVEPIDENASKVTTYGAIDLSSYWIGPILGKERRIRLPDVLTELSVIYEKGADDTDYTEAATSAASAPWSVGVSLAGQAQAGSFCIPKLDPTFKRPWTNELPVNHYYYFGTAFDETTILAKLSAQIGTVNSWPAFSPQPLTFILYGERVSATARASFQGSNTSGKGASSTSSSGFGKGISRAPVIEVQEFQDTLHAAITLSPGSDTSGATASTSIAATGVIVGAGGGTVFGGSSGNVTPTSIAATSPTDLPSSGLYLYDVDVEPTETFRDSFGNPWFFVHVVVFDFANLPT